MDLFNKLPKTFLHACQLFNKERATKEQQQQKSKCYERFKKSKRLLTHSASLNLYSVKLFICVYKPLHSFLSLTCIPSFKKTTFTLTPHLHNKYSFQHNQSFQSFSLLYLLNNSDRRSSGILSDAQLSINKPKMFYVNITCLLYSHSVRMAIISLKQNCS